MLYKPRLCGRQCFERHYQTTFNESYAHKYLLTSDFYLMLAIENFKPFQILSNNVFFLPVFLLLFFWAATELFPFSPTFAVRSSFLSVVYHIAGQKLKHLALWSIFNILYLAIVVILNGSIVVILNGWTYCIT